MERNQLFKIVLLTGVICLILSPILGVAVARITIYSATGETTDERYDGDTAGVHSEPDGVQSAFYKEFTLGYNQRALIQVSVQNYLNITLYIKIVTKGEFELALNRNFTFVSLTALNLIYSQPSLNDAPGGTDVVDATTVTLEYDQSGNPSFCNIEFMGSSDGSDDLQSRPGGYYLVIEGENYDGTGGWVKNPVVTFDVDLKVQGPGRDLMIIFGTIGFIIIIVGVFAYLLIYIREAPGGRR